ncbi:PepSY-associated TM helix domain-containing protein [Aureibacillus halotolerans]|uniref:Putative iron-regulated membrane protein n=1 Tax=Aureibacillus halotolerans TaxID=1508390 RepID=A0A4R6U8G0_9BACI|nr:PepSY domain-containing protein [Aureibacillus halotolerans]TDQ42671.1 putative iron-regulated membrane protein [Aureibacillus halotolerans]
MEKENNNTKQARRSALYKSIWRWHFYAGLIVMPFLFILALTGGIYLYKPQIQEALYHEYYHVEAQGEAMAPSAQIALVKEEYPGAMINRYRPQDSEDRSAEVGMMNAGEATTVFVDPYNGTILGSMRDDRMIMNQLEVIHGELSAGTLGDRIVELAACWAIILIFTGLYMWWPRKKGIWGTWLPRLSKGKKLAARDLHVVPAVWISAGMFFLIMTGLPWSGLWGNIVQVVATNSGEGYPPSIWVGDAPTSNMTTGELGDVSWNAEELPVPESTPQEAVPVSIDNVVATAQQRDVFPAYDVLIPTSPEGVYTISTFPPRAQDEATVHIDQYSGAVLADYRFDDYGIAGKTIALGITLHRGTQFGLINQLIGSLICLGILGIVLSGFWLWKKRKPEGNLGAPKAPPISKLRWVWLLILFFGVFFPLVGLSIIIVALIDFLIVKRVPRLKAFLNA